MMTFKKAFKDKNQKQMAAEMFQMVFDIPRFVFKSSKSKFITKPSIKLDL